MSTSLKNMRPFLIFLILIASGQLMAQYNIGYIERGNASYYADKLHGRPTASGEIYDKKAYTTAHKTIPFGTIVKITNLETGKSINLKVNDRGPFHPDKMVDISRVAAEYLDIIKKGVVPVELEILGDDAIVLPSQSAASNQNTSIDFNAPAVAINAQTQNNQVNTIPKTQPLSSSQTNRTRSISKPLPATSSINVVNTTNNLQAASIEIEQVGFIQRGKVSYYEAGRNGKITVTGEEFNDAQLVAAHQNIQLNSLVKVTNLDNGNEVMVRINDRLSASEMDDQTIIVVSEKAANTLGILEGGSADVKLEIINSGSETVNNAISNTLNTGLVQNNEENNLNLSPEQIEENQIEKIAALLKPVNTYNVRGEVQYPMGYGVQVASYNNQKSALERAKEFEILQFKNVMIQAGWSNGERSYRILIGQFYEQEDAETLITFLKNNDLKPFTRKHLQVEKQ